MRRFALWAAVLVLTLASEQGFARECKFIKGEARWDIKTSVPAGALDRNIMGIALESLMDAQNPTLTANQRALLVEKRWTGQLPVSDKNNQNVTLREGDMISVEGFLYRARCQRDGDYHLEIGMANKQGSACLIVEAPDPGQVKDRDLKSRVTQVRETLDALPAGIFTGKGAVNPIPVKITGALFLDADHIRKNDPSGGRGTKHCATNIWEIHPVTGFEVTR